MRPATEAELAEAITNASGPLEIIGGNTRRIGAVVADAAPLYTGGLSGISLYEPDALTLVAKAGTPLAEIEAAIAEHGQRLPFEPPDMRALQGSEGTPTIGGVVATNASGPRRVSAGACRDSLIGVRFVDGTGRIIMNGGAALLIKQGERVTIMAFVHSAAAVLPCKVVMNEQNEVLRSI